MYGAITLYGGPFQVPSNNSSFCNFTLTLQCEKPEKKRSITIIPVHGITQSGETL